MRPPQTPAIGPGPGPRLNRRAGAVGGTGGVSARVPGRGPDRRFPHRAGGALPLADRGLSPRHRGPPRPGRRVHARGVYGRTSALGSAETDAAALASRRGSVMGLPARGGPGPGSVECSPGPKSQQTDAASVDQFRVVAREANGYKAVGFSRQRVLYQLISVRNRVSQASHRCQAYLVMIRA